MRKLLILCTLLVLFSGIGFCLADESRPVEQSAGQAQPGRAASGVDTGDTSWVLISTALVLLMTPGLAFFYGGMVGRKNILGMLMQCFGLLCVVSIQWVVFGYSLSFAPGNSFWGGFEWAGLKGVGFEPFKEYAPTIPTNCLHFFR